MTKLWDGKEFVELHNHTYYSPLDGLSSPEEYFIRAHELGLTKLAITDHGTLAGYRHFQRAAKEAGIDPILGVEAYISQTNRFDRRTKANRQDGTEVYNHIILLAKNDAGVHSLNVLSEIGWTEGFYKKPRIDFEALSEHGDNLVVLSGCMSGLISKNLLNGNYAEAVEWTEKLKARFGEDFYIEVQAHNPPQLNAQLMHMAEVFDIKVVITGDCHYADPKDRVLEDVFLVMGSNPKKIENPDMSVANKMDVLSRLNYLYPDRFMSFKDIDVYLEHAHKRNEAMMNMGIDAPEIFLNTLEVADKIGEYEYKSGLDTLPKFPDEDINGNLRRVTERGLKMRGLAGKQEYIDRMNEELKTIIDDKDLAIYFVILWDALKFCRQNGILYGAGRGSAAGSLVCYLLEITEVDPIEHNLLFWRFLDPERMDMPDIDSDIQDTRRGEVKRYLAQKYGEDRVASVSTYTKYKAKSAIKAVSKALGISIGEVENVTKFLGTYVGDDATDRNLEEYKTKPEIADFREKYPDVLWLVEGVLDRISGYGIHPGGLVITDRSLNEYIATETRKPTGQTLRTNVLSIDGDDAADLGLVKYDFLGLTNLSVVADALRYVKTNHGVLLDWKHLPIDARVLEMISKGQTLGVFQSGEAASTEVITGLGIDSFNDLVVSNALVRPGAWDAFGKDFIARKKGFKKITFPTQDSKVFLEDTYGFPLYQEQTMQICTEIAGMSKGDANKVRKLTAKKKSVEELQPYKEAFMRGAQKNVTPTMAKKLWNDIETTAKYSFNKCLADKTMLRVRIEGVEEDITIEDLYNTLEASYEADYRIKVEVQGPAWIKKSQVGPTVWHEVKEIQDNGVQDIHRVWLDSNTYIDSTANHKHRLVNRWKEAWSIFQNDVIWTIEGKKKVWKKTIQVSARTYDLTLANEPHAFYADGFLTHNSHAVAYSMLSYTTAYLKYHYPAEFMTALLNNAENIKKISMYFAECKKLGIKVSTPDINNSDIGYSCTGNTIYMGLSNIKGIADKTAQHIVANRPYADYEDVLTKVAEPKNGLDVGMLASLEAVGAIRLPGIEIDEDLIDSNRYEYLGIPSFDTGALSDKMIGNLTTVENYDNTSVQVMNVIVIDIVSKIAASGRRWTRIDILDESGNMGLFVDNDHHYKKGNMYLMVVDKKNVIMDMDMSQYDHQHPILKYLSGVMRPGTWAVAAKRGETQKGKPKANLVYSHDGVLKSCVSYESTIRDARDSFILGERIRIAVKDGGKFGMIMEGVKLYE